MNFLMDFIDFFVSTISSIWNFFMSLIDNLLLFFKYLGAVLVLAFNLIGQMPTWLQVFGTITITVSVLYLILGRSTGGQKNE